jgi:catechol 2,3-dioxygenase-like lactoylglutathione lyase family enzyme
MPIAHVSLPVASLEASTAFYLSALAPLGYSKFMQLSNTVGLNAKFDGPDFWLSKCPEADTTVPVSVSKTHVAFRGNSKKAVRDFYAAAL